MLIFLQDKCTFSILGCCAVDSSGNGKLQRLGKGEHCETSSSHSNLCTSSGRNRHKKYGKWSCGCYKADGLLEQFRLASIEKNCWIQLSCDYSKHIGRKVEWIPKLHHLHWHGQAKADFDLHVIVYETPTYGGHHFSLGFWSPTQVKSPLKRPKSVEDLYLKQPLLDLDTVILAINCANAAKLFLEQHVHPERPATCFHIFCMFATLTWQLLAMHTSSFSTFFYVILQFLHALLFSGSQSSIYIISAKVFCNTCKNVRLRCCQILYWPIFLQDNGVRSRSCVEFMEKAALHRHSLWSSIAVDVALGNLFGAALLFNSESACLWISKFASDFTNYLLRTGCVWLMGIPAGFKLNTELAGVLGMISLNAIQIWSTLWIIGSFLFIYLIKGLAISGILFGLTTPAAFIIDMISLATVHVSTLHWLISLLYARQIQALSALWRLFKGWKWNPLRQRLDSYEYTVEQHIVGSLLFTPLLLLLPTTSAFYIFFTIMNITLSFFCIFIEVIIAVIHATPYPKIFLWLVGSRRFPWGIWLEIVSCQTVDSLQISSSLQTDISKGQPSLLVSFLHSSFLNRRQIFWPHYRYVYSAVSRSSVARSAYGVLTGQSFPSVLGATPPSKMPWMSIPYKEYWWLCHGAILGCKTDCKCHPHR